MIEEDAMVDGETDEGQNERNERVRDVLKTDQTSSQTMNHWRPAKPNGR